MEVLPRPRILGLKRQYPCPDCGRNFKRNSHLVRHKRLHTGEKPYKCPECGKDFRQSTDVNTHRRIHTGETPYHCNECGKSFRYRTGLVKHLRCHEEEKADSCPECGKNFSSNLVSDAHDVCEESYKCTDCNRKVERANLLVQLAVSATEEPYGCPDCGKSFSCSFQLIRHRSLQSRFLLPNPNALCSLDPGGEPLLSDHHSTEETESPGNICEACDDILASEHEEEENLCPGRSCPTLLGRLHDLDSRRPGFEKWSWKQSGLTESESPEDEGSDPVFLERKHLCFMCGQRFRFESQLITHERIHMGEKPFQCSSCHKSFCDRLDLSKHQKVHSGEKPFKCLDCGKSFHHQLTFIRHQGLHPSERSCHRVYFAVLPPHHPSAEVSAGGKIEPPETLAYNMKQKDPNSLWALKLAEGAKLYWAKIEKK